jgi:amidase
VPFLLKDLGALSEGYPYAEGVKAARTAGYRADHDSVITERFHAAGLVYIGRTNTPEFGLVPTTEGRPTGPAATPGISADRPAGPAAARPPR